MIFKNSGSMAGASLAHSHSQLIALPIIPKRLSEEITGSLNYYKHRDRCVFCDIVAQESEERQRVIYENAHFIAISPFASRFPFETWILPKRHEESFVSSRTGDNYFSIAEALSVVLKKTPEGAQFSSVQLYDSHHPPGTCRCSLLPLAH